MARRLLQPLRAIPRPLALLLVVVAVFGTTWALIVPAWGAPDEDAHFAYVQTIAERGELPGHGPLPASSEQRLSMVYTNTDPVTFFRYAKPEWSKPEQQVWLRAERHASRSDGGSGSNQAAAYPPAYYLYETVSYDIASSGNVLTRLYVMRLASMLWLIVTTAAAWLLAGELFGRNRTAQLVAAAATGLWPMTSFVTSSINPDAMLVALWTLASWLGVSVVKRGLTPARAAGLFGCLGLALVTKATALGLIPPVAFALLVGAWRFRDRVSRRQALKVVAGFAALALPVLAWFLVAHATGRSAYAQASIVTSAPASAGGHGNAAAASSDAFSLRHFLNYLWQFYLPRLPFQSPRLFLFPVISHYPVYEIWLGSGWATFGWANVWFDSWVYFIFLAITLLAFAGIALTVKRAISARARGTSPERRTRVLTGLFLAITAGTLVLGLHWTDFHMYLAHEAPFLQGRYLLPIGALAALVLAQATRALRGRGRVIATAAILSGLVVFQLACLGLVASRYYA